MSLFAVTRGALWESPRTNHRPDPERPTAPLRVVAGREDEARRAHAALAELWSLTRDTTLVKDTERALIRAGIVEVAR